MWRSEILLEDGEQLKENGYVFISSQTKEPYADNSLNNKNSLGHEKIETTIIYMEKVFD
ncbi:hypothetical protein ACE1MS_16920 [Lysinibacillus sp. fkY74-1]|uniref:hypothetical protein n=1 Tax=Lysinibacillus TaxID=400634 RepID=UPI000AC18230|nr:hypothetical protein [Lysinibacillus sphaericus]MDM5352150.1 hypothetical protein [Lysinibacillus sphaericus]QPA53552.1 hypothetical protein INQ53_17170 [Lysinibacillus sphaericus]QPA57883.1 hypothetical protein INQ55_17230 [Lysinibacillus sphaericus]QTB12721.1 hypothetical protein J2B92_17970 [Lysinibacillus sphaericus]QTB26076.1 hypothetical protein J2D51_17500 [Lysinibacillus sphaericus]